MMDSAIIEQLQQAIGAEKVLSSPVDLIAYSFDGTFEQHLPDVAVLPETNEEVSAVVRIASQYDVPIVPRGMSSGLAGGSIPIRGGIVLSLTRMNRILEIDEENMTATVQAGVVTADLQAEVENGASFIRLTQPASNSPPSAATWPATPGARAVSSTGSPAITYWGSPSSWPTGASSEPAVRS